VKGSGMENHCQCEERSDEGSPRLMNHRRLVRQEIASSLRSSQ
jgi:type III secretory pathway component EscU